VRVILLGPPGAGKGTQASRLAARLGVDRVSSGDLFREHQERDTELGRLARSYMERGALVPDDVTIRMVMDWINVPGREDGLVLDGFPRTLAQAEALERELEERGGIDKALYIRVAPEEMARRLTGRLVCRGCQTPYHENSSPPAEPGRCDSCSGELYQRYDDNLEAVQRRIQVYTDETEPLIEHYRRAGKLEEIDGEGSIENVGRSLAAVVT